MKTIDSMNKYTPRKTILVPLAESLDIDHTKFKNRQLLINEIKRVCPPSKRCENNHDFITLEPLDDLHIDRVFIWFQNKKFYGADLISLKQYLNSGNTINPWSIDYASGIDDASNRELYLNTHDMARQKGLIQEINNKFHSLNIRSFHYDCNKEVNNIIRFRIEEYADKTDVYITHIINAVADCSVFVYLKVALHVIKNTLNYFFVNTNSCSNEVQLLEELYIQNCILNLKEQHIEKPNIQLMLDLIDYIDHYKCITYSDGIIKYILMEFDNILNIEFT